jgi:predicted NodU family carbamoyl transferase
MIVLGLGGSVGHDPAAALVVDGHVVAAAEEERFIREKHAKGRQAEQAALYCLKQAKLKPVDVQVVAIPFAARHAGIMRNGIGTHPTGRSPLSSTATAGTGETSRMFSRC